MSVLKSEFITRPKKVNGFTGVASLFEDAAGDQVCIVCADADTLFQKLKEFMPAQEVSGTRFQNVTIIQAE